MDLSNLTKEQLIDQLQKANQQIARLQLKSITKNEDYNQPLYTKAFLEEVINQIADPLFVKNEQHRWVLLNDAFCEFMGYERKELIAKTEYDFSPKEQADVFWAKDEEVLRTGKMNVNQETLDDAKGKTHTIITKKKLYVDMIGSKFIVGLIHDLTV
ncbi:MAG: PAS domain-containing protein [Candidatus Omnitrophica bacterium]|nr:PAS domain-containing protein [Candidatus Omnitrophota bacterium]